MALAAVFGRDRCSGRAQDVRRLRLLGADRAGPFSGRPFVDGGTPSGGVGRALPLSLAVHALGVIAVLVAPLWTTSPPPPAERDYVRALLYDPPPPPPPPLPKGPGLVDGAAPRPDSARSRSRPFTTPVDRPPEPASPPPDGPVAEAGGSPTGSELGVAEGMEGGQVGGVVGGVPGGVLGGVLGGTGDIPLPVPVTGYERPPRLLRMVKPEYPSDAFVKKVQGIVSVEILIDAGGRVARARVTRSVPELDAAAVAAVRQWLFAPALKDGRPVASLAVAPVTFTLY